MKIAILDAKTLGADISLESIEGLGECSVYETTSPDDVAQRINESTIVIVNKVKLNKTNLENAKELKLICVFATGYDNIDVEYCKSRGIAVCNVEGYSSHSVSQVTLAMVLSLACKLNEYTSFVENGDYTKSGVANCLTPVYREICTMTWGIVGYGNIGREVGRFARALGCRVIAYKRTPSDDVEIADIDTLCRESDIITIHTPLNEGTASLINGERLAMMKKNVIIVNTSRGAVTDEEKIAKAIKDGTIGAFGTDVYSEEPLSKDSPLYEIKDLPNVLMTPHMAWGAFESRQRCIDEVSQNIKAFLNGDKRNRVDM